MRSFHAGNCTVRTGIGFLSVRGTADTTSCRKGGGITDAGCVHEMRAFAGCRPMRGGSIGTAADAAGSINVREPAFRFGFSS